MTRDEVIAFLQNLDREKVRVVTSPMEHQWLLDTLEDHGIKVQRHPSVEVGTMVVIDDPGVVTVPAVDGLLPAFRENDLGWDCRWMYRDLAMDRPASFRPRWWPPTH